jgi:DNA polymerase-3 subunit delta'
MVATNTPDRVLLGHGWALELLRRSLATGRLAHAFLLTGQPHVGKFTTALAMAGVLLCAEGRGCGECRHCRLVTRRSHPDMRVLELPSERRNIPIKDVHEFMQGMALRPLEAERKVYVIRDADDLAEDGANALLKTLEEPPASVTIILTAPDPGALLETIVSRCQLLKLRPAPPDEIAAYLTVAHGVDPARAETIARASGGRPGWAILAAEHPELMEGRRQRATELLTLLGASRLDRLQAADALAGRWSGHADEVREVLEVWTDVWRDVLVAQEGLADRLHAPDLHDEIARVARDLPPDAVRSALEATIHTADALERNANPRLALEGYTLLLPRASAVAGVRRSSR